MYNSMQKLISRKFYKTAEIAQNKIDVFYAVNRLTDQEYSDLCAIIIEVYIDE